MDVEVLKTVGQVAGIGGLALGVFLLLFRDIIRKNIFPKLPAAEAYRLLRLITGAVWSVAIVGVLAWVYVETREPAASPSSVRQETHGDNSPAISGVEGGVRIITPPPSERGKE
jgi:hypothetical protein